MAHLEHQSSYDVFVLYAGEERRRIVAALEERLNARNFQFFLDDRSILAGRTSQQTIPPALDKSRFVVVVVTKTLVGKSYPMFELRHVFSNPMPNRTVLPVFVDVTPAQLEKISPELEDDYPDICQQLAQMGGLVVRDWGDQETALDALFNDHLCPPWAQGTTYGRGDLCRFNGTTYVCVQYHRADAANWTPNQTPSLWQSRQPRRLVSYDL